MLQEMINLSLISETFWGSNIIHAYNFAQCSCVIEFDGASKGNPGLAGAGAVLRADDGSVVCNFLNCTLCLEVNVWFKKCSPSLNQSFGRLSICVKVLALLPIMLLNIEP